MSDQSTPPVSDSSPDSASSPTPETPISPFDALLAQYEAGVDDPSSTTLDINEWLRARSSLEAARSDLDSAQIDRLKVADATFVANAEPIATRLGTSSTTAHPSSEWWWYPNVIAAASHAQDEVEAVPQGAGRFLNGSVLFTVLEVIVLIVAVVLLLHNVGVVVIKPGPTPTETLPPTPVPTVAPTVDAALYDFGTAKLYKSTSDVLEMQLPASWKSTDQIANAGTSVFSFYNGASAQTSLASLSIQLTDAKTFYSTNDPTGKATTPEAVLQSIIDQNTANTQPGSSAIKFTKVTDAKAGTLAGKEITAIVPASAQSSEAHYVILFVPVDPGQMLSIQSRVDASVASLASPLLDKMIGTIVLNAKNVPTATVTPTILPLLITQTALQSTLNALTPTATATATASNTPPVSPVPAGSGTPGTSGAAANATTLPDGLQIIDTVVGTGAAAKNGDTLSMKYTGKLANGTVFDSTDLHGGTPFKFQLGAGNVIKGWDEGLVGMKVGGKRTLIIPSALGYGSQAQASIPANSTLTFDVELVSIP